METSNSPHFAEQLAAFVSSELGISPEDMPGETEWCTSGNTIGALCLRVGSMNFAQVEETLVAQGTTGELFGSTAIRLGILTQEVLDTILEQQRVHRALDLGSMLILRGWVALPQLLELLSRYFASGTRTRDSGAEAVCSAETARAGEVGDGEEAPDTRRFFGLHLVGRGLISEPQLMAALERQRVERMSIGRLAYEQGVMTIDQVVEVLNLQPSKQLLYGEIAIGMGFLSAEQRDELLAKQLDATLPIGQLLVQMGALAPEVAEAELLQYHAEVAASAS